METSRGFRSCFVKKSRNGLPLLLAPPLMFWGKIRLESGFFGEHWEKSRERTAAEKRRHRMGRGVGGEAIRVLYFVLFRERIIMSERDSRSDIMIYIY